MLTESMAIGPVRLDSVMPLFSLNEHARSDSLRSGEQK